MPLARPWPVRHDVRLQVHTVSASIPAPRPEPSTGMSVPQETPARRRACIRRGLVSLVFLALAGCSHRPSTYVELQPPKAPGPESGAPSIEIDPTNGDALLTWMAGGPEGWRVWFARSKDRGATWSAPVAVSPPGEPLQLDLDSSPIVVCDDDHHVGVGWCTALYPPGRLEHTGDVRFARSTDGGRTWTTVTTVNDDAASGPSRHSHQNFAVYPDGSLLAAWLDDRPGAERLDADVTEGVDASVYIARSMDFGAHWGPNAAQWSRACRGCRVAVAVDLMMRPLLSFRRHYPGQVRDVVMGRPDGPPVRVYEDHWVAPDVPSAAASLVISRDGTLRSVWYTAAPGRAGIWFRQDLPELLDSTAAPIPLIRGERSPVIAADIGKAGMSGSLIAVDADTTGHSGLTLVRVASSGDRVAERIVVPGAEGARVPFVGSINTRRYAFVAWTEQRDGVNRLRLLRWDLHRIAFTPSPGSSSPGGGAR
jgi:hypothetical protein